MFVRYDILDPVYSRVGGLNSGAKIRVKITDTDFNEEVIAVMENGINIMSPLIALYEAKGLNVGANITKCYVHLCERFNQKPKEFLDNMLAQNKDMAKYKDDIEKYLMLI